MVAYAYTTKVNYRREEVRIDRTHEFDDNSLTLAQLAPMVGDNAVSIYTDDAQFSNGCTLSWSEFRPETDTEMSKRIARGETYNAKVIALREGRVTLKELLTADRDAKTLKAVQK